VTNVPPWLAVRRQNFSAVDCTGERPVKLRQNVLLVEEKVASRARLEDAQLLAQYVGLVAGTNAYTDFVADAIL
jgi:hypothetical protein